MSFSRDRDELGQWRAYASNGYGCSVVSDAAAIRDVADVAGYVIYERRKQMTFARKVLERLRAEPDVLEVNRAIIAAACFMKHEDSAPRRSFAC